MTKKKYPTVAFLFMTALSHGQFDFPGGVATVGLESWFKSNHGAVVGNNPVSYWDDLSSNGNQIIVSIGAGSFVWNPNNINYNPSVSLTDIGKNEANVAVNVATRTFIGLVQANSTIPEHGGLYGSRSFDRGIRSNNNHAGYFKDWIGTPNNSDFWFGSTRRIGSLPNTSQHNNSLQILTHQSTSPLSGPVGIGGYNTTFGDRHFDGIIGEIITYSTVLTPNELLRIETYLAVKYGVTLNNLGGGNQGDYLATNSNIIWDADLNSQYHNDVMGIGRDDAEALYQYQSHSADDSARVYISSLESANVDNTGFINTDISYTIIGHDEGKLCASAASLAEMPASMANCNLTSRLEREWKVTKTNFSENFNLDLAISACSKPLSVNSTHLRLLIDDDGDFSNGGTSCYRNGDGTGIVITYSLPFITIMGITDVHIANNSTQYITVASISNATPLPVELTNFNIECDEKDILLSWTTYSEHDNRHFIIDRSTDGVEFETVKLLNGAGNSSTPISYSWIDEIPIRGTSYYRISQADFDGSVNVVRTLSANCSTNVNFSINPNPFENELQIKSNYSGNISLIDNTGRIVLGQAIDTGDNVVQVGQISSGVYLGVFVAPDGNRQVYKLFKY